MFSHALHSGTPSQSPLNALLRSFREFLGIITIPAEMVFHPWFGSRYFNPLVVIGGFLLAYFMVFTPDMFSIKRYPGTTLPDVYLWFVYIAFGGHLIRIVRNIRNPLREEHSQWEGPSILPVRFLPFGNSWGIVRICYEPFLVWAFSVWLMFSLKVHPLFGHYFFWMSVALLMKASLTWYESWSALRDFLDNAYNTKTLGQLTTDLTKHASVGRYALSPFTQVPEQDRDKIIASVAKIAN